AVIDTVFVRVNHANLPTLDHPPNQYIKEVSTGNAIIWHPHDGQMGTRSYTIYKDGAVDKTGLWPGTVPTISVNVDGNDLGSYNYTCEIRDSAGNYAYDTVWVYVYDGTPPEVNDAVDILYAEGDLISYIINWNGTDLHPEEYAIYLDEGLLTSGTWNDSSEVISIDAGLLPYGTYIFKIELSDIGNNEVSDSVAVTVTDENLLE
ncbi:MAG: hypothetical protein P1Q69_12830, partial [Candidatus Thorarchaeota archaeon]|nr:hypothetical protein [Candidatus Thorarchaeota archaeon]